MFSGETGNINKFINDLAKFGHVYGMSEEETANAIPHLLHESVRPIYDAKTTVSTKWADAGKILRDTFFPADRERSLRRLIHDQNQENGQSFNQYLSWLHEKNQFLRNPYREEELVDIIRANSLPIFIRALTPYDELTLREVETVCRKVEVSSAYIRANKMEKQPEQQRDRSKSPKANNRFHGQATAPQLNWVSTPPPCPTGIGHVEPNTVSFINSGNANATSTKPPSHETPYRASNWKGKDRQDRSRPTYKELLDQAQHLTQTVQLLTQNQEN